MTQNCFCETISAFRKATDLVACRGKFAEASQLSQNLRLADRVALMLRLNFASVSDAFGE